MNLIERIENAFALRRMPESVISTPEVIDSDIEETLWFQCRDWHAITWEEWSDRDSAISFFTPEAFAYYLPSILILSLERPDQWFRPADYLVGTLTRHMASESWDAQFRSRYLNLRSDELDVLRDWMLSWRGNRIYDSSADCDAIVHAAVTVDLLKDRLLSAG